jgi:hypothetical protein
MFRNEEGVFLPVFCTAGVSSLSDDGSPEAAVRKTPPLLMSLFYTKQPDHFTKTGSG